MYHICATRTQRVNMYGTLFICVSYVVLLVCYDIYSRQFNACMHRLYIYIYIYAFMYIFIF